MDPTTTTTTEISITHLPAQEEETEDIWRVIPSMDLIHFPPSISSLRMAIIITIRTINHRTTSIIPWDLLTKITTTMGEAVPIAWGLMTTTGVQVLDSLVVVVDTLKVR